MLFASNHLSAGLKQVSAPPHLHELCNEFQYWFLGCPVSYQNVTNIKPDTSWAVGLASWIRAQCEALDLNLSWSNERRRINPIKAAKVSNARPGQPVALRDLSGEPVTYEQWTIGDQFQQCKQNARRGPSTRHIRNCAIKGKMHLIYMSNIGGGPNPLQDGSILRGGLDLSTTATTNNWSARPDRVVSELISMLSRQTATTPSFGGNLNDWLSDIFDMNGDNLSFVSDHNHLARDHR